MLGVCLIFIIVIIASYYKQHSTDIKMKDYKIKTSLVRPDRSKDRPNNTGNNFLIFNFIFVENYL